MRELVIAYSIAELATALDHINALEQVGERVPYTVIGRVQRELNAWIFEWVRRQGPDFQVIVNDEVIATARAYLADNIDALRELLREEREVDEQADDTDNDLGGPT